jgi:integrase
MAGSMRRRGGDSWELRVYAGRDFSGRVRHRHATFHGTKREAERALARLIADEERAPTPLPNPRWGETTTINDALEGWSENGWDNLSPSTVRRYQSLWKTHVRDSIGRERIVSLSPFDVEKYFRWLKSLGLSEASVRQLRAMLHRACRLARKWSNGNLPNPIADTELPAWSIGDKVEVRAPSAEEVRRLLKAAEDHDTRLGVLFRVVAATGIRRGEACALRWSDIDFDAGTVQVDESVVAANGGAVVKPPKTRASVRRLAIDSSTVALLRRLQDEQERLARDCGTQFRADSFCFSSDSEGSAPPYPDVVSHAFASVRKVAGVAGDVHMHSLRHFHATALDSVVSEAQKQARLGWSTVQMARHYTDAVPEEDRRAAVHVGDLLDALGRSGTRHARPA